VSTQDALVLSLQAGFGTALEVAVEGDNVVAKLPPAQVQKAALYARDRLGFDLLTSITAVDRGQDFELLYHLTSVRPVGGRIDPSHPGYLLLRVAVPKDHGVNPQLGDEPIVPSVTSVYPGANQQEREIYDLMGIRFRGHPKLERILLWEGFPGHPLRKDWRPLNAEIPWHLAGLTGFGGQTMADAPAVARIADDGTGVSQPVPVGTTLEAFQYPSSRDPKPSEVMRIRIGQNGLIDNEGEDGPGYQAGVELPVGSRGRGLGAGRAYEMTDAGVADAPHATGSGAPGPAAGSAEAAAEPPAESPPEAGEPQP
jgi:NADH:ubiquinone oxidoreductase subunit C